MRFNMYNLEQGKKLIKLARDSIWASYSGRGPNVSSDTKKEFGEPRGVFVTINMNGNLRGCIGFPEPVMPLYDSIIQAAKSAASSDPRFTPLEKNELDSVTIEVSVLTLPRMIEVRNPEDYTKIIKVGQDGLIVRGVYESGLLLPQVAVEYKWDAKTFLEQTCRKANLPADSWMDFDRVRVYKFQSQVFSEETPHGNVIVRM
jgi:uncharacterized protein (TIGR00296 family)